MEKQNKTKKNKEEGKGRLKYKVKGVRRNIKRPEHIRSQKRGNLGKNRFKPSMSILMK